MYISHFIPLLASLALAAPYPEHSTKPLPALTWDVYLSPAIPVITTPDQNYSFSQAAITLLSGQHSAILIDCPPTYKTTELLGNWIESKLQGKKLTHVYITHGHGDHFFGVSLLQKRFPGLQVIATPEVIAHVADQTIHSGTLPNEFWTGLMPGQIPPQTQKWTPLPKNNVIDLEGHELKAINVGHTDTYNSTILHVPSLSLVIAGDVVYGSYYQYLVEAHTPALRAEWIRALRKVEALKPEFVVPSHMQEWDGYSPEHIGRTKEYLNAWGAEIKDVELGKNGGSAEMKERVEGAFPERKGDFILNVAAQAAF
ncbi:Metallo-hydrolase/oxidoreductase [Amniculicola lignicola CBS 123094]|uniref:Metallo-hydrolase/oxidoreductase n=1 Tax=Amniculicola lignicola CBS 123094 TaxID=1392246 RepID=A0A6A5WFZ3_9PLEO|nr:Metallo-hydrolase/oxidoreductase [Amniculicola lignicola CBS 123094]